MQERRKKGASKKKYVRPEKHSRQRGEIGKKMIKNPREGDEKSINTEVRVKKVTYI